MRIPTFCRRPPLPSALPSSLPLGLALGLLLALGLAACARPVPPQALQPFTLTIAHVNDTHSALEPSDQSLALAGRKVRVPLGGFARLKTALDALRAREANVLTLHAGDAVQGTLYFNVFGGRVDFEFLNLLGLDAMTLGNHEFDRGPGLAAELAGRAAFPLVSANIDASAEPALAARLRPWLITTIGGRRVGVIGATTPATPNMVATVGGVRFLPAAPAVEQAARELRRQGVDTIVLVSHLGYDQDLALARSVPGLDVIVGGHSHTLLGEPGRLAPLGLAPAGPYPTAVAGPDGARVLVVQAWRWGMQLGALTVTFNPKGEITGHHAAPLLLAGEEYRLDGASVPKNTPEHEAITASLEATGAARVTMPDPDISRRLAPYAKELDAFRNAPIGAFATTDLIRDTATDPGPLIADAYLAKTPGAQAALLLPGGVRNDLLQGPLTLGQIMSVHPFGNSLVTLELSGAELKNALEDAVDHRLRSRPPAHADWRTMPVFHAAGLTCSIDPAAPKGQRVQNLRVRRSGNGTAPPGLAPVDLPPLDPAATYILVTNSFVAGGGDSMSTLKYAQGKREDTGFLEHDVLAEHLKSLGAVNPPAERRVTVTTSALPTPPDRLARAA